MSNAPIKYNPAFLTDEQLAAAFVVRHDDLKIVMKVIQENDIDSNQHVLVIGPRGIGKTMLMRRVTLDVRQNDDLEKQWYPLVFAEESYEVCSAGEFWLEALFHLANQTGDQQWTQTYEELRQERDEDRLEQRAVAQLMDFADNQNKKILLVVENLNMILGSQIDDDCAWKLRHRLMHEPRVMLLATATAELDLPANTSKAFYEMFKTHTLEPLNDDDCQAVWTAIAGHELGPRRIRALSILTGGNPRLLTIISHFGAQLSFSDLMQDLTALVDDHTDYFKSHLEALPATERKVYVALADLWDPSLARDVAEACRLEVSKTSSLLKRLVSRGAVTEVLAKGKGKKRYRVTERMYNVYYLMRRRGAPSERVRAAVHFMIQFYEEKEILEITKRLGEEACKLSCKERRNHYYAFEGIMKAVFPDLRPEVMKCAPESFLNADDRPESLRKLIEQLPSTSVDVDGKWKKISRLLYDNGEKPGVKIKKIQQALSATENVVETIFLQGALFEITEDFDQAESYYRKASETDAVEGLGWERLGHLWAEKMNRYEDAANAYRNAIKYSPDSVWPWSKLAEILHYNLERFEEAAEAYRMVLEIDPNHARSRAHLGQVLHENLNDYVQAEAAYRKALDIDPEYGWAWGQLGHLLHEHTVRYGEAEAAYDKAIQLCADNEYPQLLRAMLLLEHTERYVEAITSIYELTDDPEHLYTFTRLLVALGYGQETLPILGKTLMHPEFVETKIDDMTALFAEFVACGQAKTTIPILRDSDCAVILEPILVALRMSVGEEVAVAPEIEQVALDVLKEFDAMKEKRTASK